VKNASEMTYTVSNGALNSTQTKDKDVGQNRLHNTAKFFYKNQLSLADPRDKVVP